MIVKSKKQETNVVVGLSVCTVVEYAQWNLLSKKITIGVLGIRTYALGMVIPIIIIEIMEIAELMNPDKMFRRN